MPERGASGSMPGPYDLARLKAVVERFQPRIGLPVALLDQAGNLAAEAGFRAICRDFHRKHSETEAACLASNFALMEGLAKSGSQMGRCLNGLWDMAVRVTADGRRVGTLFTGQFLFEDEPPDREAFRVRAARYGFDQEAYLAALDDVPRISRRRAEEIKELLSDMAGLLGVVLEEWGARPGDDRGLSRRARLDAAAADLSRALLASPSLEEMSERVLATALDLTGSPNGYVGYLREDTGDMVVPTLTPDIWAKNCLVEKDRQTRVFKKFTGLWGWVLKEARPLLSNDPTNDKRYQGVPPGHVPIRRLAAAPALAGGDLMGQVVVANAGRDYTGEDLEILERLAGLYALGVKQIRITDNLARERDFSSDVLDTAGALIVVINPKGQIMRFNRACSRATGYLEEEVLGRVFWNFLLLEEEMAQVRADFVKLKAGKASGNFTNHWLCKDGSSRLISWTNTVRTNASGEVEYLLGTGIDITDKERTEAAFREHQALLANLMRVMPNPVFYKDAQGRYQDCNPAFEAMLGRSRKEIVGRTVYDIAPSDLARIYHEKDLELLARGGDQIYEAQVRWADGSRHDVVFSKRVLPAPDGGPAGLVGVVIDISELKGSRRELEGTVSLLSSVIESTRDGIYVEDMEGRVRTANKRFSDMWGLEPDLVGQGSDDAVMAVLLEKVRDPEAFMRVLHQLNQNPESTVMDEVELKDGRVFERHLRPQFMGSEVAGRVWSFKDVSLARQRERQIALFKHFTDLATQGFGIATLEGKVHYINQPLARMAGFDDPDQAVGVEFFKCYPREIQPIIKSEVMPSLIKTGRWQGELELVSRDGRRIPTLEHFFVIRNQEGEPEFIADVITDMTELKAAQSELEEYKEHLERLVEERTRALTEANAQLGLEMEERSRVERQYRDIFENALEGICRTTPDGRLLVANPAAARLFGFDSPEQAMAEKLNARDMYFDSSKRDDFLRVVMEKGEVEGFEVLFKNRLGRSFWVSLTSRVVRGRDGEPEYIESMLADVTARRLAEEERLKFQALAENSGDFIGMATLEGDVFYLNPAGCALVGLAAPKEALGRNVTEFSHDGEVITGQALPGVRETGHWRGQGRLRHFGTGEPLDALIDVFLVRHPESGRPLCLGAIIRDIRELRAAQEELARREKLTRAMMDAITEAFVLLTPQGVVLAANQTVIDRLGVSMDDFIGRDIHGFIAPEEAGVRRARLDEAAREKRILRYQDSRQGRTIDHVLYPIKDRDGEVETLAVFSRDVTEEQEALERLRLSEERLRTAVIEAPFPVLLHAEDGEVLMVSRRWSELSGYEPGDIPTMDHWVQRAYRGARRDEVKASNQELFSRAGRVAEGEYAIRTRSGKTRVWDFSSARLSDLPDGRRLVVSMANDVTERKAVERELARSNEELQQFAYVASHDLQEPLRMVRSFMELLAKRQGDRLDARGKSYVGYAMDGASRMQGLIEDLLALSRIRTKGAPPVRVDADKVFSDVLSDLKFLIRETRTEVRRGPLPEVMADPTQLRQLFQNLVTNAVKFAKPGEAPSLEVSAAPAGEFVEFTVADQGVGIDPKDHERAFRIFQRMHSREEVPGSGMGLAICKRIVERHGGRIRMESEPGKGAAVIFTLPGAGNPAEEAGTAGR